MYSMYTHIIYCEHNIYFAFCLSREEWEPSHTPAAECMSSPALVDGGWGGASLPTASGRAPRHPLTREEYGARAHHIRHLPLASAEEGAPSYSIVL